MRNTKECSMSYRQSVMYKLTTYLKDLPLQSVSSKKNLQVVDHQGGMMNMTVFASVGDVVQKFSVTDNNKILFR